MGMLTQDRARFLAGMRAKFADVVEQGVEQARLYDIGQIFEGKTEIPPLIKKLAATGQAKLEFTYVTGVIGYLQPRTELEPFPETTYLPGHITTVQPAQFSHRIRVSREAVERTSPEYRAKLDEAGKLLRDAAMTLSKHTWDFFNHLRTAPANIPLHLFPYGDGVKLASSQHPLVGGGVVSNVLESSPALSYDALELALLKGFNMKDDTGKPMPYFNGKVWIVVNPSLARKLMEIAQTDNQPYTANFVANIYVGKYMYSVSPFITNTTQWTVVDADNSSIHQVVFKDITAEDWFDENTKAYVYDVHAEWKVGALDFRPFVHSVGNGSAITD
jgi:hypothetical protein